MVARGVGVQCCYKDVTSCRLLGQPVTTRGYAATICGTTPSSGHLWQDAVAATQVKVADYVSGRQRRDTARLVTAR